MITWKPLAEQINALPQPLKDYVRDLEQDADPAGDKWRLLELRENCGGLKVLLEQAYRERDEALERCENYRLMADLNRCTVIAQHVEYNRFIRTSSEKYHRLLDIARKHSFIPTKLRSLTTQK